MAAFEYRALDANGRSRKGVLTGESPRQVRAWLRGQGMFPLEVQEVAEQGATRGVSWSGRAVSAADLALMTRQLATLVRAGMPLEQALRALGDQVGRRQLQSVITGVRAHITEGLSLGEALSRFPATFPQVYRAMVEAGEASGRLDEILDRLADYTEEQQYLRQKLGIALIYPMLLTLVAISIVTTLLAYVVPEVIRVFEQTGQQLPLLTRALIVCSDFVRNDGVYLAVLFACLIGVQSWLMRRTSVRFQRDRLLTRLPFIKQLLRTIHTARLARVLAILTGSGVPLLEALRIGAQVIGNLPVRDAVLDAAVSVREGGRLHESLKRSGYFSPLFVHMIASGEESGELDNMLDRAATHHERELTSMVAAATALIEPLLILLMGGIVLVIVLAILLPIFELNQLVGL
jgi:general secretion pathway protein F